MLQNLVNGSYFLEFMTSKIESVMFFNLLYSNELFLRRDRKYERVSFLTDYRRLAIIYRNISLPIQILR